MDSEITMINRNSSFAVLLTHDLTGVDWRELPFEGVLWCEDRHLFEQFSCDIDGNTENCEILDDGTLRVFISGSRLSLGNMEMELTIYTPDESYPSGIRKTTNKYHLPIVLTNDDVSLLSEVNVRVTLPFIYRSSYDLAVAHGYQGSYAEFVEAVVNLPALVENTQSITADANEAAANAIQSAINANAASQNANTAAQRAEEALNDLDATLEEAIRLKDEEFATLVTKDRLREIAKPYVQGQEYEQGTLISHNNVLYVVSATATNTTPSPDNGNYTVLVDGGDEAAVYAEIDEVDTNLSSRVDEVDNRFPQPYRAGRTYTRGQYVVKDNALYRVGVESTTEAPPHDDYTKLIDGDANVLGFDSIRYGAVQNLRDSWAWSEDAIIFNATTRTFLCWSQSKFTYYTKWGGYEDYGEHTVRGVTPRVGKIWHSMLDNKYYFFSSSNGMIPIALESQVTAVADRVETAEGQIERMQDWVDDYSRHGARMFEFRLNLTAEDIAGLNEVSDEDDWYEIRRLTTPAKPGADFSDFNMEFVKFTLQGHSMTLQRKDGMKYSAPIVGKEFSHTLSDWEFVYALFGDTSPNEGSRIEAEIHSDGSVTFSYCWRKVTIDDVGFDLRVAKSDIATNAEAIDTLDGAVESLQDYVHSHVAQPYVAGQFYASGTIVSHGNTLYVVNQNQSGGTAEEPTHHNGNYTVLVDGSAASADTEDIVELTEMRENVMVNSYTYAGLMIDVSGRIVSADSTYKNTLTSQVISAGTVITVTATNSHATESVTMRMSQFASTISSGMTAIEGADVDEWVIPPGSTVSHQYYCKVDGYAAWGGSRYRTSGYVVTSTAKREPYVTVPSKTAFALVRLEPQTLKGVAAIAETGATQWVASGFVGIYDVRHLVGRTVVIRGRVEYSSRYPFFGAYSEPTPSADSVMKLSAYRSSSSSGSSSYSQVSEVLKIEEGMNSIAVSCNYATHGVYLVSDATRVVKETPKGEDYDDNMTRAELLKLLGNANDHVWQVAAGKTVGGVTYERDTWIKDSTSILTNRGVRKRIAKLPNFTESLVGALYTGASLVDASGVVAYGVVGTSLVQVFSGCYSLRRIPHLDTWDTANVTSIYTLCYECYTLETLDLHGWDTSNVVDMQQAFKRCLCLTELNLEGWDMGNVTNTTSMFDECNSLRYIHLSPSFFYGTQTLPFNGARYLGLNEDGETSNGWIEMVAETAPEITDGVERVIGLPTLLKGMAWAQPYIEMLNNKGYTIS